MDKVHKNMEKLKAGDKVLLKDKIGKVWSNYMLKYRGNIVEVLDIVGKSFSVYDEEKDLIWKFQFSDIEKIITTSKYRSKMIKEALLKLCIKGLEIKSEKIISYVKKETGDDFIFGDTILRSLRKLRQDGFVDYKANNNTRIYVFK